MKKQILLVTCMLIARVSLAQLTLDHVYTTDMPDRCIKLSLSGLKYVHDHFDVPSQTYTYFVLYNPNHTIFKTITIPQFPGKQVNRIAYVSETLFDTDTLIEFIVQYINPLPPGVGAVQVCNENGNILLSRDTAGAGGSVGMLELGGGFQVIFPDGLNTKLIIGKSSYNGSWISTTEIYNLPGQLACLECSGGVVSGIAEQTGYTTPERNTLAYPNPFKDYVKVKYLLPEKFSHAYIKLYDIAGKLIKTQEIDKGFSEVYVSAEEIKQGAYLYHIEVDGKTTASDKIIKL